MPNALFGSSVSLSSDGLIALVGAPGKFEDEKYSVGAAYIFSRSSSNSSTWTQQFKFSGDGEAYGVFGSSVSISDDGLTVLVGAPGLYNYYNNNSPVGAAFIFSRPSSSSSAWAQRAKLTSFGNGTSSEANSAFGSSVSLSNDGLIALIGAPKDKKDGSAVGAAYIFTCSSTNSSTWTQQQKLTAGNGTDLELSAFFGNSVSLSNNGLVALVGASGKNEGGKAGAGAAYIFSRPSTSASSWTQQQKLTAGDGTDLETNALFGSSVSLSSDGLVVTAGARQKNEFNQAGVGATYVFNRGTGNQFKLVAGDGEIDWLYDGFGSSVSLSKSGLVALVGASGEDEVGLYDAGAAYIFSRLSPSSLTWTQEQKLTAGDGTDLEDSAYFGGSVALSGNGLVALVGASSKNENGKQNAGAAYIFSRSSTSSSNWTQQQKLTAGLAEIQDWAEFGNSVSLSYDGLVALVGAHGEGEGGLGWAGAAYIFSRPSTSSSTWTLQQKLTAGGGTDLEYGAGFGYSVSLSGDALVALVGAPDKNEGSITDAGAAYFFSRPSPSSSDWLFQLKLTAKNATYDLPVEVSNDPFFNFFGNQNPFRTESVLETEAFFGYSVALSENGSVALIGAPGVDFNWEQSDAGVASIFARQSISSPWIFERSLIASNWEELKSSADFGSGVSLSSDGTVACVGASGATPLSNNFFYRSGRSYVYRENQENSSWTELLILPYLGSGPSLSGDGSFALVGSRRAARIFDVGHLFDSPTSAPTPGPTPTPAPTQTPAPTLALTPSPTLTMQIVTIATTDDAAAIFSQYDGGAYLFQFAPGTHHLKGRIRLRTGWTLLGSPNAYHPNDYRLTTLSSLSASDPFSFFVGSETDVSSVLISGFFVNDTLSAVSAATRPIIHVEASPGLHLIIKNSYFIVKYRRPLVAENVLRVSLRTSTIRGGHYEIPPCVTQLCGPSLSSATASFDHFEDDPQCSVINFFSPTYASAGGPKIYNTSVIDVTSVGFHGLISSAGGGGLDVKFAERVELIHAFFTNNTGFEGGAARFEYVKYLTVNNDNDYYIVAAKNNKACRGGAFYISQVLNSWLEIYITQGVALDSGGGLFVVDVSRFNFGWPGANRVNEFTLLSENHALAGSGGSAYFNGFDEVVWIAIVFHSWAQANGGALSVESGSSFLFHGIAKSCRAHDKGGAFYFSSVLKVDLRLQNCISGRRTYDGCRSDLEDSNCVVPEYSSNFDVSSICNRAAHGGFAYFVDTKAIDIPSSGFSNWVQIGGNGFQNTADYEGGSYTVIRSSHFSFAGTSVQGSKADSLMDLHDSYSGARGGGVFYFSNSSDISIKTVAFSLNSALVGAVAYFSDVKDVSIEIINRRYSLHSVGNSAFGRPNFVVSAPKLNDALPVDGQGGMFFFSNATNVSVVIDTELQRGPAANSALVGSFICGYYMKNLTITGGLEATIPPSYITASDGDSGGAIALFDSRAVRIERLEFSNHRVSGNGGAINVYNCSDVTFLFTRFSSNEAQYGGALYVTESARVRIESSIFTENTAEDGSSIFCKACTVVNCLFLRNKATGCGTILGSSIVSIDRSNFTENVAVDGAAVCMSEEKTLQCFSFSFGTAGGIFCLGSNNHFKPDSAGWDNYFTASSRYSRSAVVNNSTFHLNQASNRGGALFMSNKGFRNNLLIHSSSFSDNSATLGGSSIFMDGPHDFSVTDAVFLRTLPLLIEKSELEILPITEQAYPLNITKVRLAGCTVQGLRDSFLRISNVSSVEIDHIKFNECHRNVDNPPHLLVIQNVSNFMMKNIHISSSSNGLMSAAMMPNSLSISDLSVSNSSMEISLLNIAGCAEVLISRLHGFLVHFGNSMVDCNSSRVVCDSCNVSDATAGAALFGVQRGCLANLKHSTFSNCHGLSDGSVGQLDTGSSLSMTDVSSQNCSSVSRGGTVFLAANSSFYAKHVDSTGTGLVSAEVLCSRSGIPRPILSIVNF